MPLPWSVDFVVFFCQRAKDVLYAVSFFTKKDVAAITKTLAVRSLFANNGSQMLK